MNHEIHYREYKNERTKGKKEMIIIQKREKREREREKQKRERKNKNAFLIYFT